jgi:hypothetical protein
MSKQEENLTTYHITGVTYRTNKRFKMVTTNKEYAFSINLWSGSIWEVLKSGKRVLLKRVGC